MAVGSPGGHASHQYWNPGLATVTRSDLAGKQPNTDWTWESSRVSSDIVPVTESNPAWSPSPEYTKVAEANRQYYAKNASCYEKTSVCGKDSEFQQHLERSLSEVLEHLNRPASELRVLDACGGTGNVAIKLLKRGLDVTLTDISREQLAIFEQKCVTLPRRARVVCSEIAS